MNASQLLSQILPILRSVKEDKEKLQMILDFLLEEIYEEEPDEEIEIPEKYKKIVRDVAESIDCGFVCFLNPETLEVEFISENLCDPDEYELATGNNFEESHNHMDWEKCICVEQPESRISFRIMEDFVGEIKEKPLRNKAISILNNKKPFFNFKNLIEGSKYRNNWFAFKQQRLEQLVWQELRFGLEPESP